MAIAAPSHPTPALPVPPPPDRLEQAFREIQDLRDTNAELLAHPFYDPLRAGIDGQLARLYRAIRDYARTPIGAAIAYNPAERDLADDVWAADDAPAGAGDDVEAYRG